MSPFCAFLFFVQMIVFVGAAGYSASEHPEAAVIGAGLALVNWIGFVIAAHSWLRPRPRES